MAQKLNLEKIKELISLIKEMEPLIRVQRTDATSHITHPFSAVIDKMGDLLKEEVERCQEEIIEEIPIEIRQRLTTPEKTEVKSDVE